MTKCGLSFKIKIMSHYRELLREELLRATVFEKFVVSDFISRRVYSCVAINRSIDCATDFGWLPYKWDSLFHGLTSAFAHLPVTGITLENSDAFCFALGGEVCDSLTSRVMLNENWESLDEQLREKIVIEQSSFRKAILENEALGGQFAPRDEFYFKSLIQKLKLNERFLLTLPILTNELVSESKTTECETFAEPAYLKVRMNFQDDDLTFESEEVLPEMILNACFRCKWSRSNYEKLLSDFNM